MICFIQDTTDRRIRICATPDVQRRMRRLRAAHGVRLLATIPGDQLDELELHERFAAHRLSGKWFRPAPELLAFIGVPERPARSLSSDALRVSLAGLLILSLALIAVYAMGVF